MYPAFPGCTDWCERYQLPQLYVLALLPDLVSFGELGGKRGGEMHRLRLRKQAGQRYGV